MNVVLPKRLKLVFDEFHSESWSASARRAATIQPEDPINASYECAANALAERDFEIERNLSCPLDAHLLAHTDLLALIHPCDSKWEHTTSLHSPKLSAEELQAVLAFVEGGGGLLIVTEYEHDKYGDNLNELLAPVGIQIENGKAFDRVGCLHENPEWLRGEPVGKTPLGHLATSAGFYRAGWCKLQPTQPADPAAPQTPVVAWRTSAIAHPPHAALITVAHYGKGRIAVVTDSNLFGDERIGELNQFQLWINLAYWLAAPRFLQKSHLELASASSALASKADQALTLIKVVNELRTLQNPDGSVEAGAQSAALSLSHAIVQQLAGLHEAFPHQEAYFQTLAADFQLWIDSGFPRPDFAASLALFRPEKQRWDQIEHLVIFPLYTPNASSQTRFEAILMRTPWPDWLASLEQSAYPNPKFVPGHLVAYSDGYASECAVLFPETVSVRQRPSNHFGVIFCDREATRLQHCALKAARAVQLTLHPELECLLNSKALLLDTIALWDLIHDASHSLGELPFDPFMIRQRAPFWIYALEELRVDLRSFEEATELARSGVPFARYVCLAIVLDRIFRFPISGSRVRNYDALGGQLLFAFLHQHDVLIWRDNQLSIDWERLPAGIHSLRQELTVLYKLGAECSKMAFWIGAHDLISKYLRPNVASRWKSDSRAITDEIDPKQWIDIVHPDEFPLGSFHLNLRRKLIEP